VWEAQKVEHAMFKSIINYLRRVEAILLFVAASHNADYVLHVQAATGLSKLFFDSIKYK
jgi:hypothetical protein